MDVSKHARDEEIKSLVGGALLKEKKSDWVNGVLLRKGLVRLGRGEPAHPCKFRNRMVSVGREKGDCRAAKRPSGRFKQFPVRKNTDVLY